MPKKALIIGIDHYPGNNALQGCVNDAIEISGLLEANGDGSPNFDVKRITSDRQNVSAALLHEEINNLFDGNASIALLYFAGHGFVDPKTNNGWIVTQDGSSPNWGISLSSILEKANKAHPNIKSIIIMLDSCQSGFAGQIQGIPGADVSIIGTGVTILSACHKIGYAEEANGHGKFTDLVIDGLRGAATDVLGRVTPAALYSHVDQVLGAWEQRPIYKANVEGFITLREVAPKVAKEILRRLPQYFPTDSHVFELDPTYEPDRGEEAQHLKEIPIIEDHVRIYRELQALNRIGLVKPTEHDHMWHSAIFSGGVKLTATGAHFRRLAEKRRI